VDVSRLSRSRFSFAGAAMWRMDYRLSEDSGHRCNTAVVIPLKDRRVLVIQMDAPSQRELEFVSRFTRKAEDPQMKATRAKNEGLNEGLWRVSSRNLQGLRCHPCACKSLKISFSSNS
jgi:hypothetical protein